MTTPNWNHILLTHETITTMSADQLVSTGLASNDCASVLAHGISGIGNLLACAASNTDAGLSASAVTDIGWLLESLGTLISKLSDINTDTDFQLNKFKPGA